jgi:hypothetical protein
MTGQLVVTPITIDEFRTQQQQQGALATLRKDNHLSLFFDPLNLK